MRADNFIKLIVSKNEKENSWVEERRSSDMQILLALPFCFKEWELIYKVSI